MAEDTWNGSATLTSLRDIPSGEGKVELWKSGEGADATWGGEMRVLEEPEPMVYKLQLQSDGKRKTASGRVKVSVQRRMGKRVRLLLTGIGFPPF